MAPAPGQVASVYSRAGGGSSTDGWMTSRSSGTPASARSAHSAASTRIGPSGTLASTQRAACRGTASSSRDRSRPMSGAHTAATTAPARTATPAAMGVRQALAPAPPARAARAAREGRDDGRAAGTGPGPAARAAGSSSAPATTAAAGFARAGRSPAPAAARSVPGQRRSTAPATSRAAKGRASTTRLGVRCPGRTTAAATTRYATAEGARRGSVTRASTAAASASTGSSGVEPEPAGGDGVAGGPRTEHAAGRGEVAELVLDALRQARPVAGPSWPLSAA